MAEYAMNLDMPAQYAALGDLPGDFRSWNPVLKTIRRAAEGVAEDVTIISEKYKPVLACDEALAFLKAAEYYLHGLLEAPFVEASRKLAPFLDEPAHVGDRSKTMGTLLEEVGSALEAAATAIFDLRTDTENGWGMDVPELTPGDTVPTATPYQLFFELIFARERLEDRIGQGGVTPEDVLCGLIGKRLLELPSFQPPVRVKIATAGRPAMTYATVVKGRILFGAAGANWETFTAAKNITTEARNRRIMSMIEPTRAAMRALKALEQEGTDADAGGPQLDARQTAISQMPSQPDFVGGPGNVGLAFKPAGWQPRLPCYFCQGIFGCVSVAQFSEIEQHKTLIASI